jgi:tRNA 2-thiocytidine biosynthesis protein TtcA
VATPDAIASFLLRDVSRAVFDYGLIADGDRIAVGVSGGKDSRALLDLLVRGVDIPGTYEVVALHVDGTGAGLPDQTQDLVPWFEALGVPYEILPIEVAADEPLPMGCFRCARNRRKTLFTGAHKQGCTRVALGHHADDAAATTLLSLMYKGKLETLAPRRRYFGGLLEVIRPLILLSEREIGRYARASQWVLPAEPACPHGQESRRVKVASFLSSLPRRERRQVRANLIRAAGAALAEGRAEEDTG